MNSVIEAMNAVGKPWPPNMGNTTQGTPTAKIFSMEEILQIRVALQAGQLAHETIVSIMEAEPNAEKMVQETKLGGLAFTMALAVLDK